MPIGRPTDEDLKSYAALGKFTLADDELADYHALVEPLLQAVESIEELSDPRFHVDREATGRESRRPAPEENRHNFWVTRCDVRGASGGPLQGKVVGLKDNVALAGIEMTLGSKVMEGYFPAIDATVVTRLLEAGARIVGKLNMEAWRSRAVVIRVTLGI